MESLKYQSLQRRLGYQFADRKSFQLALTHRSHSATNNERLEFLGDSILNFLIGEALFRKFPTAREGQLSRLRAQLVKGETLAGLAREFSLGECLVLGEGEARSGGHNRDSILADTLEAVIGAIYLEAGLETCRERLHSWYASRLDALTLDTTVKDAKTRLQEHLQALQLPLPEYRVVEVGGEAHAQLFTVECKVATLSQVAQAMASSRREAEKLAAAQVLTSLGL